jgi:fatty-acyl-CoA synthase
MLNQGIGSWLQRRVEKSGSHPAMIFNDQITTYAQFAERSTRLSSVLREWGATKGTRIAYLGENHPSFLECFFAAAQLGAILVPLNTRLAPPELNYALTNSGAVVLMVSEALRTAAEAALAGTDVKHVIGVPDEFTAELSTARPVIAGVHVANLEDLIAEGDPTFVDVEVNLEDAAVIMYTSGTTGKPKGALLSHQNFTWNAINVLVDYDVTSTDVALMISPLFHVAAFGMGTLPTFLKGATLILEAGFDPGRVLSLIQKYKVTTLSGVPTTYQMLAEHPDWASTDVSSVRTLTCGGSPVPVRVLEAYEARGLAFTGGYGMTETSPGASSLQPNRSRDKMGSAGLPMFFADVRIVDSAGHDTAPDEVGEIQIQGPNVIKGYWNMPEASEAAFSDGVWFKSGDLGYFDKDGFLFISDRLKDMIISGGENIYPAEIEQMIMELPEVTSVAVFGVPDEKWGETPWAALTLVPGAATTTEDVRNHLANRVARYKIPKQYFIVDEMPRTASGKIRKNDLRERFTPS